MRLIDADALKAYLRRPYSNEEMYTNTDIEQIINNLPTIEERPHGECGTCKHFVKGGLDGKTYVCEHPNIEREDYYDYACLMVEENDFCSSYEARKKEGDEK